MAKRNEIKNLVGLKFGRLIVIALSEIRVVSTDPIRRRAFWNCMCNCGKSTVVSVTNLTTGKVRSCGCLGREVSGLRMLTHGLTYTPEYKIWEAMVRRCNSPVCKTYKNYGGRGIKVCERWLKFENFYSDMGPRPAPKLTLERVENGGNYEPSNCIWDTRKNQALNRRSNRMVSFNGDTLPLGMIVEKYGNGMSRDVFASRVDGLGWTVQRAITTPVRKRVKNAI